MHFVILFTQISQKIVPVYFALTLALIAGILSCTRHKHVAGPNRNTAIMVEETIEPHPHVNVNIATKEELETLPGIGAAMSERIIEHREKYGRFKRAEHLMMVRGFSDRQFRKIAPMVTVE